MSSTCPAPSDPTDPEPPDAVIVLGAAVVAPGVPGPALVRRVEWGVGVFRARCAGHLVLSGGSIGPPPPEAHLMRQIALDLGVDEDRIVVEDTSRNTFENAVYTGAFIRRRGWRRVVVVTDAYHLRRALYIFRRLGWRWRGRGSRERRPYRGCGGCGWSSRNGSAMRVRRNCSGSAPTSGSSRGSGNRAEGMGMEEGCATAAPVP